MTNFKAFWVEKTDDGVSHSVIERSTDDLPAGELLIKVQYSSVNYKDALSAKGLPGVTRNYPHTPGIDAAGIIAESTDDNFSVGDEVIVIGYDLGMNTAGGYGQYIRVPANWAVKMPSGLNAREAMIIGTAGFTAALCVDKIEQMGAQPSDGPVVVTGATGGVGSVAVSLLAKLGYDVVASSGKAEKSDYLMSLGATSVISRADLSEVNKRPMAAETWAHGVDTVGGEILSNVIKGLKYSGSVAICGLVASPAFSTTVLPFILRNVNILGVDSVLLPLAKKQEIWDRLATDLKPDSLEAMTTEVTLDGLSEIVDSIIQGGVSGRTLVKLED
ncbi:MAG: acrylyl-CoA reductase (NADPH) [Candidatus Azotimanducaceae bacterium]|jgi:acrylyl-CoA reductase (NADPH)